jgi:hypothetical protein
MTNLYLINEDGNIKVPNNDTCKLSNLNFKGASHLKSIFNDDPKKCFENAIKKKAFSETRIIDGGYDYIMYMCSNFKYDFFKSKVTKTKWKVLR